MAIVRRVKSLVDVDMVDIAWVIFVPRPSAMSTALSSERGTRPRATVASQDLTVAPLEQTVEDISAETDEVHHIYTSPYTFAPSFMCVDVSSCVW